ncbi:SDR family NAD(P)-dependent oxidoreductase [Desulforhopalus singaporensis]|uniref:NAD(P)-dependent dehydrogenase, short-chain alcohol dehydrogenase family n=1 Tax=Desulforhopalus singaporensis TaxID=91360 RepID=A0A1H0VVI6_9BACT|nr:SDR family oxidoreductase [Desulforhopalus singaporensis]SDP82228.1 NAD(P)-dependent dehydrogenase, short-chain alcohol dehydrogenase family [Desulforhopalus singaporensis]
MDLKLKGKKAVITAGASGIGRAIAEGLAREGVDIFIVDFNEALGKKVTGELEKKYNIKALSIKTDLSKSDRYSGLFNQIKNDFGGIDILINNVGIASREKIEDANDEEWQFSWNLNVMAAVRMARGLTPIMRQRGGGAIINIASTYGKQPMDENPIYCVTKAALVMFSKCLANEVVVDNIRVNCINPGYTLTPPMKKYNEYLAEKLGINENEVIRQILKDVPVGRFASPEEIANIVVFLCSPLASYCVGSTYFVDGGWLRSIM